MKIRHKKVRISVPATTSNLGPGFDVLGMALDLRNEIDLEILPSAGQDVVEISGEGEKSLPRDNSNMILRAIRSKLKRTVCPKAFRLRLVNRIPLARGLGSSAAARLGGILAAHALCGRHKEKDLHEILEAACRLEGHPDNVVPALFGGLRAAFHTANGVDFVQFDVPRDLASVVCVPEFELSTEKARSVLPQTISRQDAVWTAGRVAVLVRAIEHQDYGRLQIAMTDVLHQPYRKKLVPGLAKVIEAAVRAGAYGAALSGAGPSVFSFTSRGSKGVRIGRAMEKAFASAHVKSRSLVLNIDRKGAFARIVT